MGDATVRSHNEGTRPALAVRKRRSSAIDNMDDLLVAVGPSISKEHYLIDKITLKEFYRKAENKKITLNFTKTEKDLCLSDSNYFKEQNLIQLDLKKSAYRQLLSENIPNTNIDISNLCTYKFKNEFNSWRKNKTISRQWNFICS